MKKEEPIIEFRELSKTFGKKRVLNNINLKINEGEIFAIIGRSGSGKSTLMKIFLGIHCPDKGKVIFKGREITGKSTLLRKLVGLTTQENSFYDKLSVYENMVYYNNLYSTEINNKELKNKIISVLKSVELDKDLHTLAGNLSGGMKRRLDFAISLIHEPKILILDEPTTGLDPILVQQFWKIIRNVSAKGKTIIVISHIFSELVENCDHVAIIHKGEIKKEIELTKDTDLFKIFTEEVGGAEAK